jgi:hypothetical protein
MTAHGPAAIALVRQAYTNAGITTAPSVSTAVTGIALDVVKGYMDRDSAIATIAYRLTEQDRRTAAKLLDLAVEALTAQE